jgi:L-threonylcarbamoyladenylate synthase
LIGADISIAKKLLDLGLAIGIPTETVYGLGANALNEEAVLSVFKIKERPSFDPLITHLKSKDDLHLYAKSIDDRIQILIDNFWPGPLTVLLPKKSIISDLVTSGSQLAAFRMPNHPICLSLLRSLDYPLVAPSANPFMYVSPTSAQHVQDHLGSKIQYVLDGGPCTIGLESTIVGVENGEITVFRNGGLPVEEIEKLIGKVKVKEESSSRPLAPGMLLHHYSPHIPLLRGDIKHLIELNKEKRIAVLSFCDDYSSYEYVENVIVLSPNKDLNEAAQKLFSSLRLLDKSDADLIITEEFPNHGLGMAINDRLKRASNK